MNPDRRSDELNRSGARPLRSHHAAVRLHRQQRRRYLKRAEPGFKRRQIPVQYRHHIGIRHCRAGALKLADLRQHLRGECQINARQALTDCGRYSLLVPRVGIGVNKAHGRGFEVLGSNPGDCPLERSAVERTDDLTAMVEPFRHLEAPPPAHQRRWTLLIHIVKPHQS
jgi:hypothetical protein